MDSRSTRGNGERNVTRVAYIPFTIPHLYLDYLPPDMYIVTPYIESPLLTYSQA